MPHALEVYHDADLVFHSDGKWLHPLFDLEGFLATAAYEPEDLAVRDKIVGRAAALLMIHLGIGRVHAGILSELGREVLTYHHIPFTYEALVERISCQTESLLREETDPERAYSVLRERAQR
ncbi:MAG: DUF1893 domain-containing protein [Anaerolineae bacterium]|nr:DUF1893 domain-containing protein [Anaerolineae bacterium]